MTHRKKKGNKDKWKQKSLRLAKEKHFHHKGNQTAEPAVQRDYAAAQRGNPKALPWEFLKTQLDKSLSNLVCTSS